MLKIGLANSYLCTVDPLWKIQPVSANLNEASENMHYTLFTINTVHYGQFDIEYLHIIYFHISINKVHVLP